jgi:hypothetical protein
MEIGGNVGGAMGWMGILGFYRVGYCWRFRRKSRKC